MAAAHTRNSAGIEAPASLLPFSPRHLLCGVTDTVLRGLSARPELNHLLDPTRAGWQTRPTGKTQHFPRNHRCDNMSYILHSSPRRNRIHWHQSHPKSSISQPNALGICFLKGFRRSLGTTPEPAEWTLPPFDKVKTCLGGRHSEGKKWDQCLETVLRAELYPCHCLSAPKRSTPGIHMCHFLHNHLTTVTLL